MSPDMWASLGGLVMAIGFAVVVLVIYGLWCLFLRWWGPR
jgi:hypothetical protein